MKLAKKIAFTLFFTTSFLVIIPTIIFYYFTKENISRSIYDHLETTSKSRLNHIDTLLDFYKKTTMRISTQNSCLKVLTFEKKSEAFEKYYQKVKNELDQIVNYSKNYPTIMILDMNGDVVISNDNNELGKNYKKSKSFKEGKQKYFISDISPADQKEKYIIKMSAPMKKNNIIVGVVDLEIPAKELYDILQERTGLGKTGEIYLINNDKYMISPSRFNKNVILKQQVNSVNANTCFSNEQCNTLCHTKIFRSKDYRGVDILGTHEYIPQMKWCLLTEIDQKEALAPLREIQILFVLEIFFIILLSSVVGYFLAKRITNPLKKLKEGSEIIGSGNLDYNVDINTKDEIESLSYAFNKMTNNLKNSTITIDTLNNEIEKRKIAEKNAVKALQIKSEFTSLVSHELRTPLTAIKEGIAIVYEEMAGKINDEQKEVLKLANNNILRLTRLIGDILDFQKLETGKMGFDFNLSNINDLVKNIQKTMEPLAEKKGLKIELKIENSIPLVNIDKDRIEQVLSNLLSNAIKYTKDGKITIITEFDSKNVKVSVQDTGEGIKKEDMGKIFSSFTRLKLKEHVKKIEGTGLGLYICKKIIDGHLGLINVISNDGKGSVFYFTIPLN